MSWSASEFNAKFDLALSEAKKVLDTSRTPCLPGEVPHRYDDKYTLAQCLITTALQATMNALEFIGILLLIQVCKRRTKSEQTSRIDL